MKNKKSTLIAITAAAVFANMPSITLADTSNTTSTTPSSASNSCKAQNSCKSQNSCKAKANKAQNSCKSSTTTGN